mgnify:FL=1
MAGRVLVVANGEWPSKELMDTLLEDAEIVVACDGAADRLEHCDFVIGDMDSWSKQKQIESIEINGQENSDLAKALEYFEVDWIVGVEGGRIDHRLAAFTSLCETNSSAILYFDGWRACLVPKEGLEIELKENSICSLFAFGNVDGVSISGTEYELKNQTLSTGTKGVGNRVAESEVKISHKSGDLIFIWSV